MLSQTIVRSSYIILFVLFTGNGSLAYILDGNNCVANVEEVTEAVKVVVEDIKIVIFNNDLSAITKVKYGQHIKLICDIRLSSPMNITWFARHRPLVDGLSEDKKELDIKSVNMDFHGEYITCEASLVSDPKMKTLKVIGTNIVISDLAAPLINLTPNVTTVMENDKIILSCKIYGGVPQPILRWHLKRYSDNKLIDLSASGEEFTVENATFADVGQYRCTAKNVRESTTKTAEVIVQKAPVAVIEDGSEKTFPYGNTTVFTCRVEGYPLPRIVWRDGKGNKLNSKEKIINWHEKISHLKVPNMKMSKNYSCSAKNTLGQAGRSINVTILSPFVVHQHPEDTTNVHYEAVTTIVCNITASFPMRIKWFHQKNSNSTELSELHTDKIYSISSDETILRIVSTKLNQVGNYTCVASLVADENENKVFTTNLQIDNLGLPLLSETTKIMVMESNWVTLYCKIVGGVPRPTVTWQAMRHGDSAYTDISSSEMFDIENITIADAGLYRCVIKNPIGQSKQTTEVIVRKAPVTNIEEGTAITVAYASNITLTCRIVAYPLPTIVWDDIKGDLVASKETIVHEHETISRITVEGLKAKNKFSCYADNLLGEDESSIDIKVLSPFVVHQKPEGITNVHYKASSNLVCNITSSFPMRIKWFHNSSEIHTSDKFTISKNETVLSITSMDLDLLGNYTCEAYLVSDENETKAFSSDVRIDDLRPPIITSYTGATVTVKNFEELSLACKATGYPQPVMTWQALTRGSYSYQTIGTGESICSTNFGFAQAGTYKCTAANIVGEDSKTITVNVV